MKNNDMDFFHKATTIICGSLDMNNTLNECLAFFKNYMPLDSIAMFVYDPQNNVAVNLASAEAGLTLPELPFRLHEKTAEIIAKDVGGVAEIINSMKDDVIGEFLWQAMGKVDMSGLSLALEVDGTNLGIILFLAKGHNQYVQEHARLLELVHDPAAIALSNLLQHQEIVRLKNLLEDDNKYLTKQLHHIAGDEIIGREFGLKYVMEMVRHIAPQRSLVLLLGETGVGKEVIANAIHYSSPRSSGPFIKVNCGAIPDNLIDSELFGYEKGAFTGALSLKRGLFERADKGTIFLDEIGELPMTAQVRLLRVLQDREIERVGGTSPIKVDIRVITATHRDLPQMVRDGLFREDLWFRLNVFPITIPPLRDRKSDILALTRHFMDKKAREMNLAQQPLLAEGSLEKLQEYHWPGNVRELENLVERTIILNMVQSPKMPLQFEPQPSKTVAGGVVMPPAELAPQPLGLDQVMKNHIQIVLKLAGGKVEGEQGAAKLLGIHPSTLRNRMKKLGIHYGRSAK